MKVKSLPKNFGRYFSYDRFVVGDIAKELHVGSAPLYQILRYHPFLRELKGEAKKTFVFR